MAQAIFQSSTFDPNDLLSCLRVLAELCYRGPNTPAGIHCRAELGSLAILLIPSLINVYAPTPERASIWQTDHQMIGSQVQQSFLYKSPWQTRMILTTATQ